MKRSKRAAIDARKAARRKGRPVPKITDLVQMRDGRHYAVTDRGLRRVIGATR
jgi:hypothetical protein